VPEITQAEPVLDDDVVARRMFLLAGLHYQFDRLGVQCVLARCQRLVLRYNSEGPHKPSGLTDPHLYVFLSGGSQIVTTEGANHRLGSDEFPVDDPAAAAVAICANAASPVLGTPGPRPRSSRVGAFLPSYPGKDSP
jgi:hypothetical protein